MKKSFAIMVNRICMNAHYVYELCGCFRLVLTKCFPSVFNMAWSSNRPYVEKYKCQVISDKLNRTKIFLAHLVTQKIFKVLSN